MFRVLKLTLQLFLSGSESFSTCHCFRPFQRAVVPHHDRPVDLRGLRRCRLRVHQRGRLLVGKGAKRSRSISTRPDKVPEGNEVPSRLCKCLPNWLIETTSKHEIIIIRLVFILRTILNYGSDFARVIIALEVAVMI